MLFELETFGGLEVVLTSAPDPIHGEHKIRTVANQNPKWFRDLADASQSVRGRRHKLTTSICRRDMLTALRRMVAGDFRGIYAGKILNLIERERSRRRTRRGQAKDIPEGNPFSEFGF